MTETWFLATLWLGLALAATLISIWLRGLEMALKYSAALSVLSIARPPEPPVNVEVQAALEHATEFFESHYAALKDQAAAKGVQCHCEVRAGHPAKQIVHMADEKKWT